MKKTIITAIVAILLGTVGVTYAVAGKDQPIKDDLHKYETENEEVLADKVVNEDISDYEEYTVVTDEIDVDGLEAKVVEDNQEKRIIIFTDESGQEQYKTIFIKEKAFVKIISFDEGQVFAGSIHNQATKTNDKTNTKTNEVDTTKSDKTLTKSDKERKTVASYIDLDQYTGKVVENNKHKRVIVYVDENGHEQYKSIFVKQKNLVKVIDFDGGLVYEGVIGESQATQKDTKAEKKVEKKAAKEAKKQTQSSSIDKYAEAKTIANHIDLQKYDGKVVEDNKGKRIIVFSDSQGQKQYKSIYTKKNGYVKIIDFDGGMIYRGK